MPQLIRKKICILGSFGVGKTSLVRQFIFKKFDEQYLSTIGVQITQKDLEILSPATQKSIYIKLILWDLAHIEQYDKVIENYFRGANGAIIIFDMTRMQTFSDIERYLSLFLKVNPESKLILVANKCDLVEKDVINLEQLLHFGKLYRAPHFLTSAKTGENVDQVFTKMANLLLRIK
ncbi:GTP-binding protein [candidate division KSB1 bacterium]|nr:GTP-binding protein [candidate division KSB1 bacterium]